MDIIVYVYDKEIIEIGLCSKDWNYLPHGILKVVIPQKEGWREIYGQASYMMYKGDFGGIHQTKFKGKWIYLEDLLPNPPDNLKFGKTLSDKKWSEFEQYVEGRLYG